MAPGAGMSYLAEWGPRWAEPEPCAGGDAAVLSAEQVERWREHGFLHLSGLWGADEVAAAREGCDALLAAEPESSGNAYGDFPWGAKGGAGGGAFDALVMSPRWHHACRASSLCTMSSQLAAAAAPTKAEGGSEAMDCGLRTAAAASSSGLRRREEGQD